MTTLPADQRRRIAELVASAPKLTDGQRDRLTVLLRDRPKNRSKKVA